MINTHRPLNCGERNGRGDDLDGLLRRFFRSELPKNWPAPPRVTETPRSSPRPWYRQPSRFALAAAIGFFFLGYLALASRFPGGAERGVSIKSRHEIGHRERAPKVDLPRPKVDLPPKVELMPSGRRIESSGYMQPGKIIVIDVKYLSK